MSKSMLILKLGQNMTVELNVASLIAEQGGGAGGYAGSQNEHQLLLKGDTLHFCPLDRLEGLYANDGSGVVKKQITASPSAYGLVVTDVHPMVVKVIKSVIKKLKDNPKLSPITLDIPQISQQLNTFQGNVLNEIIQKRKEELSNG